MDCGTSHHRKRRREFIHFQIFMGVKSSNPDNIAMLRHNPWQVFLAESTKITYEVQLKFDFNRYRIFKFTKNRICKV